MVREGNPEDIQTWDDLVKPGVEIITPEPRLVRLGALEHPRRPGPTSSATAAPRTRPKEYITELLDNTIALPGSGREATTAFAEGTGDVLLSYENEAILAKQNGADVDYIVPAGHAADREPGRGHERRQRRRPRRSSTS